MRGRDETPGFLRWAKIIVGTLVGLIGVAGAVSDFTGFNWRQPPTLDEQETLIGYVKTAFDYLITTVPIWTIPASWLVLWTTRRLIEMVWRPQAVQEPAINPEPDERLAAVRETKDIFKDLADARASRVEELGRQHAEAQAKVEQLSKDSEEFKSRISKEMAELVPAIQATEAALASAQTDIEKEKARTGLAGVIFEAIKVLAEQMEQKHKSRLNQCINNLTSSYLAVRSDWPKFNESFVDGSVGGVRPNARYYVQNIIYDTGALARSMEMALLDIRALGVLPNAAWESATELRLDEAKFNSLTDEGLGLDRERMVIEKLSDWTKGLRGSSQELEAIKRDNADET